VILRASRRLLYSNGDVKNCTLIGSPWDISWFVQSTEQPISPTMNLCDNMNPSSRERTAPSDVKSPVKMTPDEVRAAQVSTLTTTAHWRAYYEQHVWPVLFADPNAFRKTDNNPLTASFSFMAPPFADEAFRKWLHGVLRSDCVGWNVGVELFSINDVSDYVHLRMRTTIFRVINIYLVE
jgi:hypothetical protein